MVALDAVAGPGRRHGHGDAQAVGRVGAAVDEVAEEDRLAPRGRSDGDRPLAQHLAPGDGVAERGQQLLQLGCTAVHIADDVEGSAVGALVGPQRLAVDHRRLDCGLAGQLPDLSKALTLQTAQTAADLRGHALDHAGAERPVGAALVALDAHTDPRVDHDGDRQRMPAAGDLDPRFAVGRANIGGVDHGQPAVLQPLLGDGADQLKGVGADRLIGIVVAHPATGAIG